MRQLLSDDDLAEFCLCLQGSAGRACGIEQPPLRSYRQQHGEPAIAVPHGFNAVAVAQPQGAWLLLVGLLALAAAARLRS